MTNGKTKIVLTFEMLPNDIVYYIFSFLLPLEIKGIAHLYQTVGRIVSKMSQKRVVEFGRASIFY